MGSNNGYILLLVVVACVIALIYISKKRKALEENFTATSGTSDANKVDNIDPIKDETPSGPPQNTIYEFNAKSGNCLCPFCDGENSVGAKVCHICGRDL